MVLREVPIKAVLREVRQHDPTRTAKPARLAVLAIVIIVVHAIDIFTMARGTVCVLVALMRRCSRFCGHMMTRSFVYVSICNGELGMERTYVCHPFPALLPHEAEAGRHTAC